MVDNLVKLEQILDIDEIILSNSKKYNDQNELVDEYLYNQYDILLYKKQFLILFDNFIRMRKGYKYVLKNYETKITSNYEVIIIDSNKSLSNPVSNLIDNKIDKQIKYSDLYIAIIKLSCKLTYEESVYFISTFIKRNTETQTADLLYMSRPSLDKYKKSCLFKMIMDLSKFVDEETL